MLAAVLAQLAAVDQPVVVEPCMRSHCIGFSFLVAPKPTVDTHGRSCRSMGYTRPMAALQRQLQQLRVLKCWKMHLLNNQWKTHLLNRLPHLRLLNRLPHLRLLNRLPHLHWPNRLQNSRLPNRQSRMHLPMMKFQSLGQAGCSRHVRPSPRLIDGR